MLSEDVYNAVLTQLQTSTLVPRTDVISMYDTDRSEKSNENPFTAVGMKSYTLGDPVVSENGTVLNNNREFTAEIQINFYTKFENGILRCLPLFDKTAKGLMFKNLGFDIVSYKLLGTQYRKDMDSLVLESVCTVKGSTRV